MSEISVKFIKKPTEEDWNMVKYLALLTANKSMMTKPTHEWKHKILKARHSPIRELKFIFEMTVPYYASVHLCRHVHAQPYVGTQRNDRQDKYDRRKAPQDTPVVMAFSVNAEELLTIATKRLCGKADEVTQDIVYKCCELVEEEYPEFKGLFGPPCVIYGKCMEMYPCKET